MSLPGVTIVLSYKNAVTEALAVEASLLRLRMLTNDEDLIRRAIDYATVAAYNSTSTQPLSALIEKAAERIACGDLR